MNKIIMSWGFVYIDNNGNQVGAQVGFDGPDKATKEELVIAKRRQRKYNRTK